MSIEVLILGEPLVHAEQCTRKFDGTFVTDNMRATVGLADVGSVIVAAISQSAQPARHVRKLALKAGEA